MRKIALITTNKILAQSLVAATETMGDVDLEFFLMLNSRQALMDTEILGVDIALIDVINNDMQEKETPLEFCERLKKRLPECHLLLLVSQDNMANRKMATKAKKNEIIDDFVFYDASLKYLISKLKAFN